MLRLNLLICCGIAVAWCVHAQQQVQFTQFGLLKQYYNPAHAGSFEGGSLTALHRTQWVGVEGAPTSQALSFHLPLLYGRVGLGGNLYHTSIGVSESWTLDAAYAYRIPMDQWVLSLGLQASLRYWGVNYSDPRIQATQGVVDDDDIPIGKQQRYLPNFGVGLYLNNRHFFAGVSAPRVIEANIDFSEEAANNIGKERIHFYAMTGVKLPVNAKWEFLSEALLKVTDRAPLDANAMIGCAYDDAYTFRVAYRIGGGTQPASGEALGLISGVRISKKVELRLAYDIGLSPLRDQHSGSWEVALRYAFNPPQGDKVLNPRYF